ncbi:hypothetical protein ACO0QE_002079 [Hanseniaspora vineae]
MAQPLTKLTLVSRSIFHVIQAVTGAVKVSITQARQTKTLVSEDKWTKIFNCKNILNGGNAVKASKDKKFGELFSRKMFEWLFSGKQNKKVSNEEKSADVSFVETCKNAFKNGKTRTNFEGEKNQKVF